MLKYILFQHFTRFLLQYIYNASDVQNEIQQSSDGTLDADEGQGQSSAAGTAATASSPGVTLGTAIRQPVTVKSRMV